MARAEAADLQVPSGIRDEIGIGEARNLTDDRDEGDQINEQSKNREGDGEACGGRDFHQAWRPPARLDGDIGKPGDDIFDGENRREDPEEWRYQGRAEGGKR